MDVKDSKAAFVPRAGRATTAIPRRMQLAFPELASLFPLLIAGHVRGKSWRQTLDSHTEPMTLRTLVRLADELNDLYSMSDSDRTFETICIVIGLDLSVAIGEYDTLYQLVAAIEERVSAERLAHAAQPAA